VRTLVAIPDRSSGCASRLRRWREQLGRCARREASSAEKRRTNDVARRAGAPPPLCPGSLGSQPSTAGHAATLTAQASRSKNALAFSSRKRASTPGSCSGVSPETLMPTWRAKSSSCVPRSASRSALPASGSNASPMSSWPCARSQNTPPGYAAPKRSAYSCASRDLPIPPIPTTFTDGSPLAPVISL
jgi:hypothetical protein